MIAKQKSRQTKLPQKSNNRSRKASSLGVIERGKIYPQPVFCKLAGITRFALRSMRARGLKVKKDGRYSVILGDDYHDYVESLPTVDEKQHQTASAEPTDQETPPGVEGSG